MLLELALAGDRDAERKLMENLRDALVRQARRHPLASRSAPFASTEDLADETFVRIFSSGALASFEDRGKGALLRFMCTALDGVIVDVVRRGTALKRAPSRELRSIDDSSQGEIHAAAYDPGPATAARVADLRAICEAHLDGRQLAVWRLAVVDELPPAEIASRLGITAAAARGVLHRVRAQLSQLLDLGGAGA